MKRNIFSLSIVLPAYNEEKNIKTTLDQIFFVLPGITDDFEVIVVDDGSRDKTPAVLSDLKNKYRQLEVIGHRKNRGYGNALISGFNKTSKDFIFFIDLDGQFDFKDGIWKNSMPLL